MLTFRLIQVEVSEVLVDLSRLGSVLLLSGGGDGRGRREVGLSEIAREVRGSALDGAATSVQSGRHSGAVVETRRVRKEAEPQRRDQVSQFTRVQIEIRNLGYLFISNDLSSSTARQRLVQDGSRVTNTLIRFYRGPNATVQIQY